MDDSANVTSLQDWGASREVIPFMAWAYSTVRAPQIPPQIQLPQGWSPRSKPSLSNVVDMLRRGAGLSLHESVPVDVALFREGHATLSSLECVGNARAFGSLESVEGMVGLQSLSLPRFATRFDLAHLDKLRVATISHAAQVSVAKAPNLTVLGLRMSSVPSTFTLEPQIHELDLDVRQLDMRSWGSTQNLREVVVTGASSFDVTPLADAIELERLIVMRTKEVTGLSALRNCRKLKEVVLSNVHRLDDVRVLLELSLMRFEGVGPAFDDDFAVAAGARAGWWVPRPAKAREGVAAPFVIREVPDDLIEVALSDMAWFAARTGLPLDSVTTDDVEQLVQHELERTHPQWLSEEIVILDSEADEFIAIVPNTQVARTMVAVMSRLFADTSRLRVAVRSLGMT
ncbi:hypothetical protein [Microbacterium sp. NPDC077184]|uniref:hypothetical protein n=1 Tax=Microbacterium sp. NPDC077184 TaxID=3154764 RepID=UPI00344189AC